MVTVDNIAALDVKEVVLEVVATHVRAPVLATVVEVVAVIVA